MDVHYCWIYAYTLLCAVLTLTSKVMACPLKCTCQFQEARCVQVGLIRIPPGIPSDTTTLHLQNNRISGLPASSFSNTANLVNLQMANNLIVRIDRLTFRNLTHLQVLDLKGNMLTSVTLETFRGSPNLIDINLSANRLNYIQGAFLGLKQLTKLDLSNNEIEHLSQYDFKDLVSLQELVLSKNRIYTVHPQAFAGLTGLLHLDIHHNPMGSIGRLNFTSEFLDFVDMSECNLTHIPRRFPQGVNYLQLRRNTVTTIRRDDFQNLPNLERLILDENQIEKIDRYAFAGTPRLQELWLNTNKLKRIPLNLPTSVESLHLQSNQITEIQTWTFPEKNKIKQLNLMDNNISHIDWNALHPLRKAEDIDLSNNKLTKLTTNLFQYARKLDVLKLAKNPLKYFYPHCFYGLTGLKVLTLAYIHQDSAMIANSSFADLLSLRRLSLDSSIGITHAIFRNKAVLGHLSTVDELSILSTDLTTVRLDFPSFFPDLKVLHISSSVWHCDSRMIWFKRWLLQTNVRVPRSDELTCFSPVVVYSRPIIHLKDSEFIPATTSMAGVDTRTFPHLPPTTTVPMPSTRGTTKRPSSTLSTRKPTYKVPTSNSWVGPQIEVETIKSPKAPLETRQSTLDPETSPGAEGSQGGGKGYSKITIIAVAVSVAATVFIFILVLTVILMLRRKDKKKGHYDTYGNAVKYRHKNNVLYFVPKDQSMENGLNGSAVMSTSSSKDASIALVPGRDITEEGPRRVYKWEDF